MNRRGFTLIELLAAIFVVAVAIVVGMSVARKSGVPWLGSVAGLLAGSLCVIIYVLLLRWDWRREQRRLKELREKYRSIYRVVAVPADPKIILMPEGAEIRIGDYGWEAGPMRSCSPWCSSSEQDDGLIYLQGLTLEWTVVWHAGFQPNQIEWVATKPNSQYDSWHRDWEVPPPLPPCPFPVIERKTLTVGRPHHSHRYFVMPAWYPTPRVRPPEWLVRHRSRCERRQGQE